MCIRFSIIYQKNSITCYFVVTSYILECSYVHPSLKFTCVWVKLTKTRQCISISRIVHNRFGQANNIAYYLDCLPPIYVMNVLKLRWILGKGILVHKLIEFSNIIWDLTIRKSNRVVYYRPTNI